MLRIGIHQDHEIIRKPGIFEVGVGTTTGDLFGPLQHPIHRGEIQITEERREHPALRNSLFARGLQHQLEHVQHVRVIDPLCHLCQEQVMPDIVKVRLQIHVNDAGLVLHNRLRHAQDRVMGRALWAIAVRPRLEVRFKDGFQDELEGSLDHTVTDRRNREDADTLSRPPSGSPSAATAWGDTCG